MQKVCGIDVGSVTFETCVIDSNDGSNLERKGFNNNPKGIKAFIEWVSTKAVNAVIMEATGGYERKINRSLIKAGIKSYVVNPAQVRHFAQGLGKQVKTDKIDAEVIARFGQVVRLESTADISETEMQLKDLTKRREELKQMTVAENNRLNLAEGTRAKSIKRIIKFLNKEVESINEELKRIAGQSEATMGKVNKLTQHKGIGFITAVSLVSNLPELYISTIAS